VDAERAVAPAVRNTQQVQPQGQGQYRVQVMQRVTSRWTVSTPDPDQPAPGHIAQSHIRLWDAFQEWQRCAVTEVHVILGNVEGNLAHLRGPLHLRGAQSTVVLALPLLRVGQIVRALS
jgi:hypothetical protein